MSLYPDNRTEAFFHFLFSAIYFVSCYLLPLQSMLFFLRPVWPSFPDDAPSPKNLPLPTGPGGLKPDPARYSTPSLRLFHQASLGRGADGEAGPPARPTHMETLELGHTVTMICKTKHKKFKYDFSCYLFRSHSTIVPQKEG